MEFFRRRATEAELHQGEEEMKREQQRLLKEAYEERTHGQDDQTEGRKAPGGVGQPDAMVPVHSIATPAQTPSPEMREGGEASTQGVVREDRGKDEIGDGANPFYSRPREVEDQIPYLEEDREVDALSGPLFNEEQVRRFEELQRAAPMLVPRIPEAFRPAWMTAEDRRLQDREAEEIKEEGRLKKIIQEQERLALLDRMRKMEEEVSKFQRTSEELRGSNQKLLRENQKLRMQIEAKFEAEEIPRREEFRTPEEGAPEEREKKSNDLGFETPRQGDQKGRPGESPVDPKMMMKGMLKLMEGMQMMQSQILEVKKEKMMEVVKGAVSELPKLPDWKAETAPLDLTDWLLTIEPAMGGLSDGSQQWWEMTLGAARSWYAEHQEKTPLEKVNHPPKVPDGLNEPRFQRLEKRIADVGNSGNTAGGGHCGEGDHHDGSAGEVDDKLPAWGVERESGHPLGAGCSRGSSGVGPGSGWVEEVAEVAPSGWGDWGGKTRCHHPSQGVGEVDEEGVEGQRRPGLQNPAGKEHPSHRYHSHRDHRDDLCQPSLGRGGTSGPPRQEEEREGFGSCFGAKG